MSDEPVVKPTAITHLRDARGHAFQVNDDELEEALATGDYRVATPDEIAEQARRVAATTTGSKVIAAGEGVLKGATFGLGTALAAELGGEEYRERALDRAKHNRGIAIGSEIAGTVLPSLLTGGAGAAGAVARATPAALAGRAALGVERVVEGGVKALGLAGEGLAASTARAGIRAAAGAGVETAAYGLGTSLADSALEGTDWTAERALAGLEDGAVFGARAGALLGAGGAVISKVGKAAAREIVNSMATGTKTFRRAVESFAEDLVTGAKKADDGRSLIARLTDDGASPERLERIAAKFKEHGVDGASRAEVANVARNEAAMAVAQHTQLATNLAAKGIAPNAAALKAPIQEAVERLGRSKSPDAVQAVKRLQAVLKSRPTTIAEAEALATKVDGAVRWARDTKATALPELEKVSSRVNAQIDNMAEAAGPDVSAAWREARQGASDWRELARRVGKEPLTDSEIGKIIGMVGSAASIATGSVLPFVGAAVLGHNPAVRQFARERGGAALGWLASRAGHVERAVDTGARTLAGLQQPAESAMKALAGQTSPKRRRGVIESTNTYGNRESENEKFAALSAWILQSQSSPKELADHITAKLAPIAHEQPEVASAMAMRIVADHAYLASKLPPGPAPVTVLTKSAPPQMSHFEQQRILRYARALDDPPGTIAALAAGQINWEGAEALRDRRPLLWEGFRMKTMRYVATRPDALPYKRRLYLSVLFGQPLDPSLMGGGAKPPTRQQQKDGQQQHVALSKVKPAEIGKMVAPASATQ